MDHVLQEIPVPDIGDFKDIEVIEVLVKPGDVIRPEDSLITLESDKAAMEVPSPLGGTVSKVLVKAGDRVSQGSPIVVVDAGVAEVIPVAESQPPKDPEPPVPPAPNPPSAAPVEDPVPSGDPLLLDVNVPDIGDFKDIEVIEVLVKPGDRIEAEASLITLESDKAAMEVPSPAGGIVREVRLKPGDRVSQGSPVLLLETSSSRPVAAEVPLAQASAPSSSQNVSAAPLKAQPAVTERPEAGKAGLPLDGSLVPPRASPAVRKFARELGVDLLQVSGTANKSRITREDIQRYVKGVLTQQVPATGSAGPGWSLPPLPVIDFSKFGPTEERALTRIQKRSGPNLHRNWVSIPHITQHEEADITELEAFRNGLKREAEQRGLKLSILPFVMKAVAASLRAFPTFNASLNAAGDALILKQYVHLGVAVDTLEGLVVPVVRDVDQKSLFTLADELRVLSQKARDKKLRGEDLEGGCFTLSSLGGIGGTAFTPIINAPEVAILGLSRSQIRPVYLEEQFVPRLMLPLSLSYDHRVIDGAEAARFIVHLSRLLQDFRRVLL